jgi:hypothetical protein
MVTFIILIGLFRIFSSPQGINVDQDPLLVQKNIITRQSPLTTKDELEARTLVDIGSNYSGFFVRDSLNKVWFLSESEIWYFSLAERQWEYYGKVNGMSENFNAEYDPKNERFLLWERDGSGVMEWRPGSNNLSIISGNDSFKLLRGHSWFISPNSGTLYTFGGRGYGIDHGTMYSFMPYGSSWNIVQIEADASTPPSRKTAHSTYLPLENEFHLFSGIRLVTGRQDISRKQEFIYDYWVFDLDESRWTSRPIYGMQNLNKEIQFNSLSGKIHQRPVQGTVDSKNKLIWYPFIQAGNDSYGLFVYDIKAGYGIKLPDYLLGNQTLSIIRFLTFDQLNNELLVFWTPFTSSENSSSIKVTAYELPTPTLIRSYMEMEKKSSIETDSDSIMSEYKILAGFTGILAIIAFYFYRSKERTINKPREAAETYSDSYLFDESNTSSVSNEYIIDLSKQPKLFVNSKDLDHEFSPTELHVLIWLSWKAYIGEAFQITDTIEELFFNEFPNLDYARKHRNITIKRINEQLRRLIKGSSDQYIWIIERPVLVDKRKREYGLDVSKIHISVRYPDDEKSFICPGLNYKWVEDIRKDILTTVV